MMEKEIKERTYRGYLITVYSTEKNRKEKYRAHSSQFGSATSMKAAFELPRFNEYGDDVDELIDRIKRMIDDIDK